MSDEPQTGNEKAPSSGCFLKGIAALAALVTIASGAIKIGEWWEQRSQLTADVSVSGFALPPHAAETQEKLEAAVGNTEAIRAALDLPKMSDIDQKLVAMKVASYLRTLAPHDPIYPWRRPQGIWSVEVKNDGSTTCSSVSLTLPSVTGVRITRPGKDPEYLDVNAVIDLGELKPKDVIKVIGWGDDHPDEEGLKLVHHDGVGNVRLMRPVSPFWLGVAENADSCFVLLFMGLFVVGAIAVGIRHQAKASKGKKTVEGDASPPVKPA